MKETVVISAFPCVGKTYAFENSTEYKILDSDSSQFSWIKNADGENTSERNPDFPANYIKHIKENIGLVDIIFVSSHKPVREALREARVRFCTVYPDRSLKNEWIGRAYTRGSNSDFVKMLATNWNFYMDEIETGEFSGVGTIWLKSGQHISELLSFIYNWFQIKLLNCLDKEDREKVVSDTFINYNKNQLERMNLCCDCGSETLVFETYKWGPDRKFDSLTFSIQDDYMYKTHNTFFGRLGRAFKVLFGKPICYAEVDSADRENVVKFLEGCLNICKEQ